jgi:hypothetical protein
MKNGAKKDAMPFDAEHAFVSVKASVRRITHIRWRKGANDGACIEKTINAHGLSAAVIVRFLRARDRFQGSRSSTAVRHRALLP